MNFWSETLASLPWYDLPETRWATDALWSALVRQFRRFGLSGVPERLNRTVAYEQQWTSPRFLFGQACGYDVRIAFAGQLQVLATPCYRVSGCRASNYSSYVVVREDAIFQGVEDLRGSRCVINTPTSHSGMNVLRGLVASYNCDGRFFSDVRISGSHEASLRLIIRGDVDVAAIDCVTYALLSAYRPRELNGCRILYRTEHVPAPPFVTGFATSAEIVTYMREALIEALDQASLASAKETLFLGGVEILPAEAYQSIETLASLAHRYNYGEIPDRALAAESWQDMPGQHADPAR